MNSMPLQVRLLFQAPASGQVTVRNGEITGDGRFQDATDVLVSFSRTRLEPGSHATVATVSRQDGRLGFSFFLRDVDSRYPIWLPAVQAAVIPAHDDRDYAAVVADITARNLKDDFAQLESQPEQTAEDAFRMTRTPPVCPTWLGVGRDPRIFEVCPSVLTLNESYDYQFWGYVCPRDHAKYPYQTKEGRPCNFVFMLGPGAHCAPKLTRRLLEGWMPILTSVQDEKTIRYELTIFASQEEGPLTPDNVGGVDLETAYTLGCGRVMPKEEENAIIGRWRESAATAPICIARIRAVNPGSTPAYAWFKSPELQNQGGDFANGLYTCPDLHGDSVLAISRLNDVPLPDPEVSVLVKPGESCLFDIVIPHQPISRERAEKLLALDFDAHFEAAKRHWRRLAESAAAFSIPETAIDERARAGLPHIETLLTGPADNSEPLLANAGVYTPIGTESSPIIQYLDSIGLHDKARRCIEFFLLHRQQPNGYIQCFSDYQSETGPVLWTVGEHFRYTHDIEWLRRFTPRLKLSCEFLLDWRNRNKTEEARAAGGWGLASGKVADPMDFFHSFFLNAGNYAGLARMAEILVHTDPEYASFLAKEVVEYRQDIRNAIDLAIEHAPAIPLEDGSWTPAIPAWTEQHGATILYVDGGKWFTHGDFAGRDILTGPLWLGYAGAVDYDSPEMDAILRYNQHPQTSHNAAISQPFYCRHDIAHIARGEVKLFLQTFYNQMAALQDRETYTFWEHYYTVSIHKTHEEAWFLMLIRWMLWFEPAPDSLRILAGAPSHWFRPGQVIEVRNACGYCGKLSFRVDCTADSLAFAWSLERPVSSLEVRLPIPDGHQIRRLSEGTYDPQTALLTLTPAPAGRIILEFSPLSGTDSVRH